MNKIAITLAVLIVISGIAYAIFKASTKEPDKQLPITPIQTSPTATPTMEAENLAEEIQSILANKYARPVSEVKVTIIKQTEGYVGGSILFGQGGPGEGGMFLARKVGNIWEVVYDGNGNADCNKMRQEYGFPDEILKPNFCE